MRNMCAGIVAIGLAAANLALSGCAAQASRDMSSKYLEGSLAGSVVATAGNPAPATNEPDAPTLLAADMPPAAKRMIIYQAGLGMVVRDIAAAQRAVKHAAEQAGGYLQEVDGPTIAVRIPAAKFDDTLSAVEKLGEVTQRHVKANDVTEEMRDLAIRLDNAEQVRKRLTDLLDKAQKMEDTIKLEQELERVTQTIELLKGKIQFMHSQIAMSTIRVTFNSTQLQKQAVLAVPFAWIRELGDGVVAGVTEPEPDTSRLWKRNERFTLPPGFVRYYERDHVTEAMSGDEIVIKLRRQDNYDGGEIGFWKALARKALVENRAIAMLQELDTAVKDRTPAHPMIGEKDLGTSKQGYVVGIAATKRYVYTFEAWGDKEKVQRALPALQAAFESLDVKHW